MSQQYNQDITTSYTPSSRASNKQLHYKNELRNKISNKTHVCIIKIEKKKTKKE